MSQGKVNGNYRVSYNEAGKISAAWSYTTCLYFRAQDILGVNVLNVTRYSPTSRKHLKELREELAVEDGSFVEVDGLEREASLEDLAKAAKGAQGASKLADELAKTLDAKRSTDSDWHRVVAGDEGSTRFYVCPHGSTVCLALDDVTPALARKIAKLVLKEGAAK